MHGGGRAIFGADRVCAVVAGNGKRISKYVVADPALPGRNEISAVDFIHTAETTAYLKIVFVFAGHLAGFTAGAARGVDEKSQLFVAHRRVMCKLTHAFATSTSMV
ncbi:hypothetical protein K7964_000859 [Salmonella enterica]|nr:hypothetical protein [Salmonella enterica]EIB2185324.1 hypothetical protein [Salmonella enterica]EJT0290196.1 hypothetical protein [Salmonella enterica]EJU7705049.1 hypothetical protein [Salmonella enterica]